MRPVHNPTQSSPHKAKGGQERETFPLPKTPPDLGVYWQETQSSCEQTPILFPSPSMEFPKRHERENISGRKGQKRKLEEDLDDERPISFPSPGDDDRETLLCEVGAQVNVLNTTFSWTEADRAASKRATHVLAELAKNGNELMIPSI